MYFCLWRPICEVIERFDEWLSVRLLPDSLSGPATNAKVVQHGIPLMAIGGGMWWKAGGFGLAMHGAVTLICIAFAPYRYPGPYAVLRWVLREWERLLGWGIIVAFFCLVSAAFIAMSKHEEAWKQSSALKGNYQMDCAVDNFRRTMPDACRTAVGSQECIQSEWAKRVQACRSAEDMVKKAMESVPRK